MTKTTGKAGELPQIETPKLDVQAEKEGARSAGDGAPPPGDTADQGAQTDQGGSQPGDVPDGRAGAIEVVSKTLHDAVVAERDQLKAMVEKLEGLAAKVKVAGKASNGRIARKFAPMDAKLDGDELADKIHGPNVSIAFSDGKHEIVALEPVPIGGANAWDRRAEGWMLRERIVVAGPEGKAQPYRIEGFVLLIDDKPVAYSALPEPATVVAGGATEFRDTILF